MKARVAIVGAGVAGLSAAVTLAKNDHNSEFAVEVFERKNEIGSLYKSTGGIAFHWLNQIDLDLNLEKTLEAVINKVELHSQKHETTIRTKDNRPLGVVIDHRKLEKHLAEQARKEGVRIHTGVTIKSLKDLDHDFIIGADGTFSEIARETVGLPNENEVHKCLEYWIDQPPDGTLHLFFKPYCPKGYIWAFPSKDYIKVGAGIPLSEKERLPKILEKFLKERPEFSGKILEKHGGCVPTPTPLPTVVPKSYIALIGDAGRLVNSATGGGLHLAMLSGISAALSLVLTRSFARYESWYISKILPELRKWSRIKKALWSLTEDDMDTLVKTIGGEYVISGAPNPLKELEKAVALFLKNPKLAVKLGLAFLRGD